MKFELFGKKELPPVTPEVFATLWRDWNESPFVEESIFIKETHDGGRSKEGGTYSDEYEVALKNVKRSVEALGYSFGENLEEVEQIVLGLFDQEKSTPEVNPTASVSE